MSWVLVLPLTIPFVTAIFAFLFRERSAGRWISVAGSAALVAASLVLLVQTIDAGVLAAQMGSWAAPFGVTLVADLLSAAMAVMSHKTQCKPSELTDGCVGKRWRLRLAMWHCHKMC